MRNRFKVGAVALLLAAVMAFSASPAAAADPAVCGSGTWGQGCVDIDTTGSGQWLWYSVDDQGPPDGRCVYLYVYVLGGVGWSHVATSCGAVVQGSTSNAVGVFGGTLSGSARITRGPWPGVNYASMWTSPA